MGTEQDMFSQVATTLARHFDSLYYIESDTGHYIEFLSPQMLSSTSTIEHGDDFFAAAIANSRKFVHPDDLERTCKLHNRETLLDILSRNKSCSNTLRLVIHGKIIHARHVYIMCEDKKHIIYCMENIDDEFMEKEAQRKNLKSAERLARMDELTGIKNKNAFSEYSDSMDKSIKAGDKPLHFALVMCDVNDLKHINDTRGHSFGDEAIQRASRMICDTFKHSPVFRIGGDEFVAILIDHDYEHRNELLEHLREESAMNAISRSGPELASGMAVYDPGTDTDILSVFTRADQMMYANKNATKAAKADNAIKRSARTDIPIPNGRKQALDRLFGALITVTGGGYIFLNDLMYDYSRWSLDLVTDFGLRSEYMYHAGKIWQEHIHPNDLDIYKDAVDAAIFGDATIKQLFYRARKADGTYALLTTRAFILNDNNGNPEYFGGIILPQ